MTAAATALARPTAAPPAQAMDVRMVPIDLVVESAWNPRKHWVTAQDADLEASIRKVGILTPLLVRPVDVEGRLVEADAAAASDDPRRQRHHYELAAGHRRIRASRAAGLPFVPVQVRHMTDEEFREVLIVENLQRADIHPLDEADAYAALHKADGAYTPEAIAARVGKSSSYVYKRLKLTELSEACREAYWKDEITAAHAERLARLAPALQDQALAEVCFRPLFDRASDEERREPEPVSDLDHWIEQHTKVETAAPETQHYFPEVTEQLRALEDGADAATILQLSESQFVNKALGTKKHGALGAGRWKEIGRHGVKPCANVQKGVVVHGGPMRIIDVCATKGCPKHFPVRTAEARSTTASAPKGPDKWELENQRRERERTAWNAVKEQFYAAAAVRGKALKASAVVDLVLDRLFRDRTDLKRAHAIVGDLTPATFGAYVAVALAFPAWGLDDARRQAKALGFDLGAIEQAFKAKVKELAPKSAPTSEKSATSAKGKRR